MFCVDVVKLAVLSRNVVISAIEEENVAIFNLNVTKSNRNEAVFNENVNRNQAKLHYEKQEF